MGEGARFDQYLSCPAVQYIQGINRYRTRRA